MQFDIQGDITFLHAAGVLKWLLEDRTTRKHILWGTDAYRERGPEYARDQEMEIGQITGENSGLLKTRAQKAAEQQTERTRQHAEVFTPAWICRKMNDQADQEWFRRENVFFREDGTPTERIDFKRKSWRKYADSKRLEITCGEAPYLVSRYNVSSGEPIPIGRRVGLLDRKLRVVDENTDSEADWLKWTFRAFEATYGYEFQGDNLLIARVNLVMTFVESLDVRWHRQPSYKEWKRLARVVTWNIWQMDGLTYTLPYAKGHELIEQTEFLSAFGLELAQEESNQPYCKIYLWRYLKASTEFRKIKEGANAMKFDFIIGNPPYQDETLGDNKGFAPPIYHIFTDENGQRFRKRNAYVFDFDPARTLIIFDEFANNLRPETAAGRGTGDDREQNIKRLLNFFPVLGEDSDGKMVELDAKAVLSIPRRLKSQEVVRRGFMSNFLFQNIGNIFGAPGIVREIVEKLTPAHEEPKRRENTLDGMDAIQVDDQGEVEIPHERVIGKAAELFGPKIYEDMGRAVQPALDAVQGGDKGEVSRQVQNVIETVKQNLREQVFTPIGDSGEIKKGALSRIERQAFQEVDTSLEKARDDYLHEVTLAEAELKQKRQEAETETEVHQAEWDYHSKMEDALQAFTAGMQNIVEKTIQEKPREVVEQIEKHKEEEKKHTIEDTIRDHLRGFSRTIPSFIMAYGDGNLTLSNFDDYTEDDVFLEVTGITEDDFRFLRDGGDAVNPETGETEHFDGHLFDEVVFNDSIQEFWTKKQALADYFDETHDEDIFDYIPPQKTNQIFTPRWVVQKMVDELEAHNPGCFDDPDKTFADLYMKSGLYITEIVKRLFRSERMKALFPDDHDRIRHIMTRQVYGMAPTRIIYLIATNYILGFDDSLKLETRNFVQADAAEAAKKGTLGVLVERYFE